MKALRFSVTALLLLAWAGCTTPPHNPGSVSALAVLASDAGVHEKARACQELAVVGGSESVPALANLLGHEVLADYARSGLEAIADPSAGQALRRSLGTLEGRALAGVVNSLGVRRDLAAVPALQVLVLDTNRGVAMEALASLGMIGTVPAAKTIQTVLEKGPEPLRVSASHAALVAAERLAQTGGTSAARSLLAAMARSAPSEYLQAVAETRLTAFTASSRR